MRRNRSVADGDHAFDISHSTRSTTRLYVPHGIMQQTTADRYAPLALERVQTVIHA